MITKKIAFWTTWIIFTATIASAQQQAPADDHQATQQVEAQQQDLGNEWLPPWIRTLSPEKQTVLQRIYESGTDVIYPLMMQLRAQQFQLQAELAKQEVNRREIDRLLTNMNNLETQIDRAKVDLMLEVKKEFPRLFLRHGLMGRGMGMGFGKWGGMGMIGTGCPAMDMTGGGMMGGHGMMGGKQGMMGGGGPGMMGPGMGYGRMRK